MIDQVICKNCKATTFRVYIVEKSSFTPICNSCGQVEILPTDD